MLVMFNRDSCCFGSAAAKLNVCCMSWILCWWMSRLFQKGFFKSFKEDVTFLQQIEFDPGQNKSGVHVWLFFDFSPAARALWFCCFSNESKSRLWTPHQHNPSPPTSLLADGRSRAPPSLSICRAHQRNQLSRFGSQTQTAYVHLGARYCLQIQICTHVIKNKHKYVQTCTRSQMSVNSMQHADMLRSGVNLCGCRKPEKKSVGRIKASGWIAFYLLAVWLATWLGNPSTCM